MSTFGDLASAFLKGLFNCSDSATTGAQTRDNLANQQYELKLLRDAYPKLMGVKWPARPAAVSIMGTWGTRYGLLVGDADDKVLSVFVRHNGNYVVQRYDAFNVKMI